MTLAGVTVVKQNSFACTKNEGIAVKKVVDARNPAVMVFMHLRVSKNIAQVVRKRTCVKADFTETDRVSSVK